MLCVATAWTGEGNLQLQRLQHRQPLLLLLKPEQRLVLGALRHPPPPHQHLLPCSPLQPLFPGRASWCTRTKTRVALVCFSVRVVLSGRWCDALAQAALWDTSVAPTVVLTQRGARRSFQKQLQAMGVEVRQLDARETKTYV